jgi:hypothetical protein
METMLPHLEPIARALDNLHPTYYVDFDTTDVPALILAKQEREGHLLQEFQAGLITANEYRQNTGRKNVVSDLADSMLANPNLAPIGNPEKPMETPPQGQAPGAAPQTVMTQAVQAGAVPGVEPMPPAAPQTPPGVEPGMGIVVPEQNAVPPEAQVPAPPTGQLSAEGSFISLKGADTPFVNIETKADESADRWTEILDAKLENLFERQQRVILEKALGPKARKLMIGGTFDVGSVFDKKVWDKQISDDMRPIISGIVNDAANSARQQYPQASEPVSDKELQQYIDSQVARMQQVNETTREEIAAALLVGMAIRDSDERNGLLRAALMAIFAHLINKRKRQIAEHEAQSAYNAGLYLVGKKEDGSSRFSKRWVTRKDDSVRSEHRALEGKAVPLKDSFTGDGVTLRFPGDPLAPPGLTINCRCRLRIQPTE